MNHRVRVATVLFVLFLALYFSGCSDDKVLARFDGHTITVDEYLWEKDNLPEAQRNSLRTIEDKNTILRLLEKISDADVPQVFIGSENPLDELKEFSFVAAPYCEGTRPIGAIAVIGPTRMNYSQAITLVDLTAKFITDIFSYSR